MTPYNTHKTKKKLLHLAVLASLGLIAFPAAAQEGTNTQKKKSEDKDVIQEIIVSATRQATSLLKTPVAVTAITQESLAREGIVDVRGLSGSVPNLQLSTGADSGVQISIRGVSSNNFTEIGDPAVGLHVAGLYTPRPQAALALLFDLDQVEVLRGPQGTLFGRNSTAGSINLIPAKPEFGSSYGSTTVDIGNYHQRQFNVIQNIAINDKLALRASLMSVKRDGWVNQKQDFTDVNIPDHGFVKDGIPDVDQRHNRAVSPKDFYNNKNEWAARLAARFKPSQDIDWLLTVEKFQNNGAGDIGLKDCDQAAGTRFACQGGRWDVKVNVPGKIDMSIDSLRSALNWNLDKQLRFEYGFSYSSQKRSQQADDDSGYHPVDSRDMAHLPVSADGDWGVWPVIDNSSLTLDSKYVSTVHDMQLKHATTDVRTVVGAFWMHEKNQINYSQEYLVNAPFGFPISQYYQQPDRQIDAKALYAQTDWQFQPSWTATLGARFSQDSKTDQGGKVYGGWDSTSPAYYNGLYHPGTPGTPGFRAHNSRDLTSGMGAFAGPNAYHEYGPPAQNAHSMKWNKLTYRLGIMKELSANEMLYSSLSTGYKSGGFGDKDDICGGKDCVNGPAGPQYSFFPYKPETVTNMELGYKARLLDKRLNFSMTGFFSQYKDMQVTGDFFAAKVKHAGPCPEGNPNCDIVSKWQTTNVGVVDIRGVEMEVDYKPWAGARLGAFFSYLSTKMKDYPSFSDNWGCGVREEFGAVPCPNVYVGSDPRLVGRQIYDITGNNLPLSPRMTLGLNFSQEFALGSGYTLTPWIAARWQDKMYFTLRNLDNAHLSDAQKAYSKIDASLTLGAPDQAWSAEVYVLNWTNSRSKNSAGDAGGFIKATWNDPRMFGIRLNLAY